MKNQLLRVMNNCILTYQEMTTILYQTEQVLNNHPFNGSQKQSRWHLCAHPVNISQRQPIGCYPTALLAKNGCPRASNKTISRKWRQERAYLSVDDVVLIAENLIPPLQWRIGHVTQLNRGQNGLARMTLVKISRDEFSTPVSKLRRLPVKDNDLQKQTLNDMHTMSCSTIDNETGNCVLWLSGEF